MALDHLAAGCELTIIDADPPARTLNSCAMGDIDGNGREEIVIGGNGAMMWYDPVENRKGIIDEGLFHVGLLIADVDDDGAVEIIVGKQKGGDRWELRCYHRTGDRAAWTHSVIDPDVGGGPHDIICHDVNDDGRMEIIANAMYSATPALYYYTRDREGATWTRHTIQTGFAAEGLCAGDIDGDGRTEVILGPDVYYPPAGLKGEWTRQVFAPSFREMCRTALVDITGTGHPAVVIIESEYRDGMLSWFEPRPGAQGSVEWTEHQIDRGYVFAHSLDARRSNGVVSIFLAEMAAGGWWQPMNFDARLREWVSVDAGVTWAPRDLYKGAGTHQALLTDVDGDGLEEIVGKEWGELFATHKVQVYSRSTVTMPVFRHRLLDRDKPETSTDILAADVDRDGVQEAVCGRFWYDMRTAQRYEIPGVYQVIAAHDIDGDGFPELIATRPRAGSQDWYSRLCADLCWCRPVDARAGCWEMFDIGRGSGDWIHGSLVGRILPGDGLALIAGYHDADGAQPHYPEIFEAPQDPRQQWKVRTLAPIAYGEEFVAADLDRDGIVDIAAGPWWLRSRPDGTFKVHTVDAQPGCNIARIACADIDQDGWIDIVAAYEAVDYDKKAASYVPLCWYVNPRNRNDAWERRVIDKIRSPHSLVTLDLDGDGEPEIVAAEHDPFSPYRSRSRLFAYKKADRDGTRWKRFLLEDRFELHDALRPITLPDGRTGLLGIGWAESSYVHCWEIG